MFGKTTSVPLLIFAGQHNFNENWTYQVRLPSGYGVSDETYYNTFYLDITLFLNLVQITNKMQPCIRIYYSTVHWRLNMFRVAYRSSSGALTVFAASGLPTHVVTGRSQVWVGTEFPLRLDYGRSPHAYAKPEAANTVRALDDERCWRKIYGPKRNVMTGQRRGP